MAQDTQPPAETLAITGKGFMADGPHAGGFATIVVGGEAYSASEVVAALTRRAGGDAIPSGEVRIQFADPIAARWSELSFPLPTPKPPAGGDAETKGWDHRYRSLAWGDVILDTDECRRDDGTWVTGICVGQKAPDPAYTSHRVYRRLISPAGGDAGELAAFGASDAACTLYPGEDQAAERAAFVAGAALALPAPVVEGWQPIETAILWGVYIVTDGEHVALAQYAESDWGGNYWAVDPEDALEWSPTHCITPPAALSEGRSHG